MNLRLETLPRGRWQKAGMGRLCVADLEVSWTDFEHSDSKIEARPVNHIVLLAYFSFPSPVRVEELLQPSRPHRFQPVISRRLAG